MFFIIREILVWVIWLIFANKKRWKELLPVSIFAGNLGLTTDVVLQEYMLWDYKDTYANHLILYVLDDWGIYPVVTYLFIQWLPTGISFMKLVMYFFIWTVGVILIEWFHVFTGHMIYYKWWNLGCSYLADWFLFWLLFKFHQILHLKKLTQ